MSHSEGSPPLCINRRHRQGPGVKGGPAALVFLQHRWILITAQTRKASRESSRFGQLCVSVLTEERTNVTQPPFSSLRGTQVGGESDEASSLTRAQLTEVNKTGESCVAEDIDPCSSHGERGEQRRLIVQE